MFALIDRFAYRHRWLVIAGWLVVLVAGVVLGSSVFGRLDGSASRDDEPVQVEQRLAEFGGLGPDVVILLDGTPVNDQRLRDSVAALARDLRAMPDVRAVIGPGSTGPNESPNAGPGPEAGMPRLKLMSRQPQPAPTTPHRSQT